MADNLKHTSIVTDIQSTISQSMEAIYVFDDAILGYS